MNRYLIVYRYATRLTHNSVETEEQLLELVTDFQNVNGLSDTELKQKVRIFDLKATHDSALTLKKITTTVTQWSLPSME